MRLLWIFQPTPLLRWSLEIAENFESYHGLQAEEEIGRMIEGMHREAIMSAFRIPRSMMSFGDENETTPTR